MTYVQWASREHSERRRAVLLVFLGAFFLWALPLLLLRGARRLDTWSRRPPPHVGRRSRIAGAVLGLIGGSLGLSSVAAQVGPGSGTPLPVMPTKRLVVSPPFTCCRNPMTLGTILSYLGVGVWFGSVSMIGVVAALGAVLLTYVRFVEERELEARFGPAYLEYKRSTPFLLPRLRPRTEVTPAPKQIDVKRLRQIFRVVNWFMLGMWHLHLGWCVNIWPAVIGRIMVITHTGRTSGIRRETPVNYAIIDGDVWCTTVPQAAWSKNLVINPDVEVWLPRGRWRGTAHDVPVDADSVPMLRQVLVASGFAASTFGGIHPRTATDAELVDACGGYRLFRIHRGERITGRG